MPVPRLVATLVALSLIPSVVRAQEVVEKSLRFLKFQPLDGSRTVIFNLPVAAAGVRVLAGEREMTRVLEPRWVQVYRDHRGFPWLRHLAVGARNAHCYVIYKTGQVKGLPSAEIVFVSDGALFLRYCRAFGGYVLRRHAMATTRVESRMLPATPRLSRVVSGYRPRMFRSVTLSGEDIDNLYSELVALDI